MAAQPGSKTGAPPESAAHQAQTTPADSAQSQAAAPVPKEISNLLELVGESYFETDLRGRLVYFNDYVCRFHGRSREELTGLDYRDFMHPAEADKIFKIYSEVYRSGAPSTMFEYEIVRKDGTTASAESAVSLHKSPDGRPIGFCGITRDITEKKKFERAVRQSEEKHRSILANMEEGYYEVDLKGAFTVVNEATCRTLGRRSDELVGLHFREFMPPQTASEAHRVFSEVYRSGMPAGIFRGELIRKDGSTCIHEMSVSPLRSSSGKIIGFYGISRDLTERLEMEKALRESEHSYRSIMELCPDTISINRADDGRYVEINAAFCRKTGYTPEQTIGRTPLEMGLFAEPDGHKKLLRQLRNESIDGLELQIRAKDGTIFDDLISGRPIQFKGQSCFMFVATLITPLKQAQQALRDSEESYRRIIEMAPGSITIADLKEGRYLEINENFCRETGYSREETIGKTVMELNIFESDDERRRFAAALRATGRMQGMEFRFQDRNKDPRINLVSARVMPFKGRRCVLVVGTLINDLKAAQQALEEREAGYRTILETAPYSITLTRRSDLTLVEVNEAFCRRTGYQRAEIIGRTAADIDLYVDDDERRGLVEKLSRDGSADLVEMRFRAKDGRITHTLVSARPMLYQGEECVLSITIDIAPLKKAEQELRESEESYRMILAAAPYSIVITSKSDSRYVQVNEAFCRRTGFSRADVIGRTVEDLAIFIDPADRKHLRMAFENQGRVHGMEIRFRTKDGRTLEDLVSVNPIRYKGEECLLSMAVDITERKRAERELDQYRRHLEEMVQARTLELEAAQAELIKREKLAVLGQLTATVSHELRNPLGVIRSSNFYLQRRVKNPDEKVDKHFRRIEEQVSLCDAIVADLLEFTRGRNVAIVREDMGAWLEALSAQMRDAEGVAIELQLDKSVPPVPHDREKMRRAVLNVLENAVQAVKARRDAGDEADYRPHIVLKTEARSDQAIITIKDNGVGMTAETLARAFEPLFTTRARGTGIGLANVRKIVEEHGGRVVLESKVGEGSQMMIRLPCR